MNHLPLPHFVLDFCKGELPYLKAASLVWKTVQLNSDGTREDYSSARGSKLQAPVVSGETDRIFIVAIGGIAGQTTFGLASSFVDYVTPAGSLKSR